MTFGELLDVIGFNQIVFVVADDGYIQGYADTLSSFLADDVLHCTVQEICVEDERLKVWIGERTDRRASDGKQTHAV